MDTVTRTGADLIQTADRMAHSYLDGVSRRRVFPSREAIEALQAFDAPLGEHAVDPEEALRLLDEIGGGATVTNNGPRYFGFVIGAALPAAAAAERLALAWDQCASSFANSPAAAAIEKAAARHVLEVLDLPKQSAVGFGTSATACGIACLTAARRSLLKRAGWDFDARGLAGAPAIRVIVPETVHVTVLKALRILGFGLDRIERAPCDEHGRIDPERLPALDARTILCLQAGEVNTGEFDRFADIVPAARDAGAWVHVDGAFGLWVRASTSRRHLTDGVDAADSWTTDGHKWLNTPYDCGMAICRDPAALSGAMNADAVYSRAEPDAQKNLTLEFSRRARGIAIWAALQALGRRGVEDLVDRHCALADRLAAGLQDIGLEVLNRVPINQVLARAADDAQTQAILTHVQEAGDVWFGGTRWAGRPAFRLSVSSWRTGATDIDAALDSIAGAAAAHP